MSVLALPTKRLMAPTTLLALLAILLMWSPQVMLRRKPLRENVRRVSSLTDSHWSSWYTAMVPRQPSNNPENYERREGHEGFINSKIRERFRGKSYDDGIYELRASRGSEDYVVYAGKASGDGPDSINKRIRQYSSSGSHKHEAIDRALKNGYTLSVRAQNLRGKEVEEAERRHLDKYDYAWNDVNNDGSRKNVPPP